MRRAANQYFATLAEVLRGAEVTDLAAKELALDEGCEWVRKIAHETHDAGNKIIFVGNGGSAGIASHLAIDFSKNGGLRALAFNDPAALTCLGNDLGYENVFAKQLDFHGRPGDLLIAISSSGLLAEYSGGCEAGARPRLQSRNLFGIYRSNELRRTGDINFYRLLE